MNNVIISNRNDDILSLLNIDAIKKVTGEFSIEEIISMFENFFFEKMIIDITAIKDYTELKNIQKLSLSFDTAKLIILLDGQNTSSNEYISALISMGIYNFTKNAEGIMSLMSKPNTYRDVAAMQNIDNRPNVVIPSNVTNISKVFGVKNVTEHAGATSLIYMLKKHLSKNYRVVAIEVDKNDFMFYNDKNMISTTNSELTNKIMSLSNQTDLILLDLNDSNGSNLCNDIIYLLEPSTIKVNKLIARNRELLKSLNGKKVILNQSLLSQKDVQEFSMESGIKIFYVLPPLNDRIENNLIDNFLMKLGFLQQRENIQERPQNRKFNIFGPKN